MPEEKRNRASAIILRDGKILLIKRTKPTETYYVFPGGGIEAGESPETAIIREIKEETNLDAKNPEAAFRADHPEHGQNHFFFIKDFTGENLEVSGPEAQRANENNQFSLEWISTADLDRITLYPEIAKEKLLDILKNQ